MAKEEKPDSASNKPERPSTGRKRVDESCRESEERYRGLVELSPDAIALLDLAFNILNVNPQTARLLGLESVEEIIGKTAFDFVAQEDQALFLEIALKVIETGIVRDVRCTMIKKNGDAFPVEFSASVVPGTIGKPQAFIVIVMDITDRCRIDEAMRENQSRLDLALSSAGMGVWYWDLIENRRFFDERTCRLLGINPATFTGAEEELFGVIHPDDRETVRAAHARTIEQDILYEPAYRVVWPDGSVHHVTSRGRLVRDVKGQPVRINGVIWDITEQRINDDKIRALEGSVKHIVDNSLVGVFQSSTKGEVLFINEPLLRILEFESKEELNLRGGAYALYKDSKDREKLLDLIVEKGQFDNYELEFVTKTKRPIHILVSMRMENDVLSGTVLDITERKKAEAALRESEDRFATIFRVSPICTSLTRLSDGQFFDINEEFLRLFGYDRNEVIGSNPLALNMWVHLEDRTKMLESLHTSGRAEGFETLFRTKSGEIRNMLVVAELVDIASDRYILGLSHDITKQKKAEREITELLHRNELILNSAAEGILGIDLQGNSTFVNQSAAWMLGYEVEELIGKHAHTIWHHSMENGSIYPEDECPMYATIRDGKVHNNIRDEVFWRKDGTSFSVAYSSTPIVDNDKIIGAVVNFRDITERRRAEEAVRDSEEFIKRIVDASPNIIYIYDLLEHRNIYANNEISRILGYSAEDAQEMGSLLFESMLHPDDQTKVAEHHRRLAQSGDNSIYEIEYRMRHGNGAWRWLLSRDTVFLRTGNGLAKQILGVAQDITERKLAEEEISRQLAHLEALRDIDRAITSSFDLRLTLKVVLEEVKKELQVDAADLLLFNRHLQTLEYAAGIGFKTSALQYTRLPFGKGHAGQAAIEQRIIHIPNLSKEPGTLVRAPLFAKEGFISYYAVPLLTKGQLKGVLEIFHRSPCEADAAWLDFLDALATQAAIALDNAELFNSLQRSNVDLIMAYDATIEGWSRALDYRDRETEGHSRRVTEMTVEIAQSMGMNDNELLHMRRGSLLHDIGKMGIPDSILLKPGKLTEEEWEVMRKHPVYAYNLLSPIDFLRPALDIPYCHHEKWDGSGYPRGLKGEQIPLSARIFSVVDVWDALTSTRPYRPAWTKEKALEYIRERSGRDFDPEAAAALLSILSGSE